MAEQKTKPTEVTVESFLDKVASETVRDDCQMLIKIMKKITGEKPKMWGPTIVGFGKYHYKYASGHEGYSCVTGFSPRKPAITVYIMPGFTRHDSLLKKLGKYKTGKGCLYIKKLEDVDTTVLEELIRQSVDHLKKTYPG